jgi:HNH endonuclease
MVEAQRTPARAAATVWLPPSRGPTRDPERELAALVRTPPTLRRALARVAGRMVAARGWERLGFARLEDYAAERAGVSARELRDLAAVDRALGGLPVLDAAFARGEIGWTQLRLVCRVATADDQRGWLALARRTTARALAHDVRKVDCCASQVERADRVGVVLRCTPAVRAKWWRARQRANRVAGHTLSGEAFAEALAAEVCSAVPLQDEVDFSRRVPRDAELREFTGPCADATPLAAESPSPFCVDLERDLDTADASELDARLCRALRLEARRLARVAMLLDEVVRQRRQRAWGFRGLDRYAEERLGMAPSRARALLRVARAARHCPPLHEAFATGRISWVQAHALVAVLLEPEAAPHRGAWVAHAERVSVRRLSDDVAKALAAGEYEPGRADPDSESLQTGASTRPRGETARLFFAAAPEVAHLFRATLATVRRRLKLATLGDALDGMLEHALAEWSAPPNREHRVFERDGWRCTVPGCSSYRNLHGHHIVFRSQGGSDELANLTTLCAWHHQRGVHAGVVRCTGQAPDALHFELGRPPVLVFGPGEVRMPS